MTNKVRTGMLKLRKNANEVSRLRDVLETARTTLAAVRKERDDAHRLLRVLRTLGYVPEGPLRRAVNGAVALESECAIEEARREVDQWIITNLPDEPPFEVGSTQHDDECEAAYIPGPWVPCLCADRRKRAYVDKWLADHDQVRVSREVAAEHLPNVVLP